MALSKTEKLFAVEAQLRIAAHTYASTENLKDTSNTAIQARAGLQKAARAYAAIAAEIDDCFDGAEA